MMKINLSHRISAIFMATLMLLSTKGFSMDIHFCQGNIDGISMLGKTEGCCNQQSHNNKTNAKSKCADMSNSIDKKDNCCHNEHLVINKAGSEAPDLQLTTAQEVQFDVLPTPLQVWNLNIPTEKEINAYQIYHPPIPDKDIQVLYQSFLI
jgi:hypothetical protein